MPNALTPAANENLPEVVQLENDALRARWLGQLDAAVGFENLASALRSGQLTRSQLNTSNDRCRLFGARALDL